MRSSSLVIGSLVVACLSVVACTKKEAAKDGAPAASSSVTTTNAATPTTTAAATAPAAAALTPAKLGLKAGEEIGASCDTIKLDSECGEILTTDAASKGKAAQAMTMLCKKGAVGAACPTTDLIGSCRVMKDGVSRYYATGGKKYDLASAKAACTKQSGRWVD